MERILKINSAEDILPAYLNSPISRLLEYHNLDRPYETYNSAELLIGMCMDNRKHLHIPENFAYIIRSGGANLRYSEFRVSYAIAVGGVKAIALIGHNNCGMVNLMARRTQFIKGLVENAGWPKEEAEDHFYHFEPMHEIGNEVDFVASEAKRMRLRYPKILVAPMFYNVNDNLLYLVRED
ncbi:MAG: carbonic anhydrase [Bacteroidetes bacterium]|nr:carbonic anhydrase [Bacteroidota bacterium]MBP6402504.1 carbonic anhydrase [Bacteroidia bacterium]MBK6838587.1 carbonic anhydrase [Bacteroidota bacterium]MBK9524861.1 carbonic anhydrase [Bacteroidota bacterium]MBK9543026.1 carbonic anhydrase [Bacteroidota bacterium]